MRHLLNASYLGHYFYFIAFGVLMVFFYMSSTPFFFHPRGNGRSASLICAVEELVSPTRPADGVIPVGWSGLFRVEDFPAAVLGERPGSQQPG